MIRGGKRKSEARRRRLVVLLVEAARLREEIATHEPCGYAWPGGAHEHGCDVDETKPHVWHVCGHPGCHAMTAARAGD